jgi:hypothetical protein
VRSRLRVCEVRIIVCGSRSWNDRKLIENTLYDLAVEFGCDMTIVHGNAQGADRIAAQEAEKAGLIVEPHKAHWGVYGKPAGPIRNSEMAAAGADLCIAFGSAPEGSGTADMVSKARAKGIPVRIVERSTA